MDTHGALEEEVSQVWRGDRKRLDPSDQDEGAVKKIQKKYYLPVELTEWLREASFRSRFSQSQILEACLTLHLMRESMKGYRLS